MGQGAKICFRGRCKSKASDRILPSDDGGSEMRRRMRMIRMMRMVDDDDDDMNRNLEQDEDR